MLFKDRNDAGRKLAEKLIKYKGEEAVILALPRGGVVVGYEVSSNLGLPLGLVITRKIGHPRNPEYAICAVAEDGHMICDEREKSQVNSDWLEAEKLKEIEEARRRRILYLGKSVMGLKDKTVIIIDDGVATGMTLKLAIEEVLHENPKKVVVSVPVAPKDMSEELKKKVDEFVALNIPEHYLGAVGSYYENFEQVSDERVINLLEKQKEKN